MLDPYRVLLVDDDIGLLRLYELILTHAQFSVRAVTTGKQAVDTLEEFPPDIIISDLMMAGMNGIELCKQVRSIFQWRETPFLVLTASSDQSLLSAVTENGATRVLRKPIRPVKLVQIIEEMVSAVSGSSSLPASETGTVREAANYSK